MSGPSRAGRRLLTIAVLVAVLVAGIGVVALSVSTPSDSSADTDRRTGNATAGVERLHAAGVTGEDVTVAVVGVTGFDTDHPALAGRVVAARSFAAGESIRNGGRTAHGTAAASLVVRAAPDADLYLTSFDTAAEFEEAVAWVVREDVDVVVAPVEFYGVPGDGSSAVAGVARLATEHGTVFVASAGNLGRGHWEGSFAPDDEGRQRFGDGARNYLLDGGERRATLWLSWEAARGANATRDFTLELYRATGDGPRLVAKSQPYRADDVPNERIVAEVDPGGTYYYVVRGPTAAAGARVEVSSPTHTFQFRERAGSLVAPATAEAAVAVGAYDTRADRVESFSSAGPTTDGRPGVDLVAPNRLRAAGQPEGLVGSSAAAPYAAGVAALLLEVNPNLTPREVERVLQQTARDVGPPGVDPVAGHGLVAPERAVAAARNVSDG